MEDKQYGVFEISYQGHLGYATELARQKAFQAAYQDGYHRFGFSTYKVHDTKNAAHDRASIIRHYNSPKHSTSRLIQLGLWHTRVVVHEVTKKIGEREGYWKLSKKDLEEARQTELYQRLKTEAIEKNSKSVRTNDV